MAGRAKNSSRRDPAEIALAERRFGLPCRADVKPAVGRVVPRDSDYRSRFAAPGFTLIELIVVIVLVAVLAAMALPRFVSLGREARIAKLEAAHGAIAIGAVLANSISVTQGLAPNASVVMEGATVTMSLSYPTPDAPGVVTAANLSTRDYQLISQPGDPANSIGIAVAGGSDINNCRFLYISPAAQGTPPTFASPVITGC